MSDVVLVSAAALAWLQELARARDIGDGWLTQPPDLNYDELVAMGVVEHRPDAFRLTDIGWWTLGRASIRGDAE